jgi:GT2 family glycosyltransferase
MVAGRRQSLALIRVAFSVLKNEGWSTFFFKVRKRMQKYQRSSVLYSRWTKLNEPTVVGLAKQKRELILLNNRPKISLLLEATEAGSELLGASVDSVLNQTYDNWELLLYSGRADNPCLNKQFSEKLEKLDKRINVQFVEGTKDISVIGSEAMAQVCGEFVGFLDQGDQMAPFALYEAVKTLNENPGADFIYSDEDSIDLDGKRSNPFFKPDWSPDMQLSWMYTGRFSIYRKKLVGAVGGLRRGFDDGWEYDLSLRTSEKARLISHIAKVLYHRRKATDGGRTNGNGSQPAEIRALGDYLARNQIRGEVCDGLWPGSHRVKREIIGNPLVSIIIPTKDNIKILERCIESILATTGYANYEIVVVDNQSQKTEELLAYYREIQTHSNLKVVEFDLPFNFAALNNYAAGQARGQHLLFLNSDTEVISREWLSAMLEQSQRKEVGAAGAKLLFPDGSIQHCGVILGLGSVAGHAFHKSPDSPGYFGRVDTINDYSAVTAACMMVRKEVFEEVGGLDENLAIDYNDIDFCLKVRALGYLVVYTPYAQLFHLESYVRGYADSPEKRSRRLKESEYFTAKWDAVIEKGDPYYNPNLSLTRMDFALEAKPRRKS